MRCIGPPCRWPFAMRSTLKSLLSVFFRSFHCSSNNNSLLSLFLGVQQVALQMKGQVEEFKPYIPLIQGLRNPGMRIRHWDLLSKELGFSVQPKVSTSVADVLVKTSFFSPKRVRHLLQSMSLRSSNRAQVDFDMPRPENAKNASISVVKNSRAMI